MKLKDKKLLQRLLFEIIPQERQRVFADCLYNHIPANQKFTMLRLFLSAKEYAGLNTRMTTYWQLADIFLKCECRGANKKKATYVLRLLGIKYEVVKDGKQFTIKVTDEEYFSERE